MAEVHQRPRGRKDGDLPLALERLRTFVDAAGALQEAWHDTLNRRSFPRYLPSFEELVHDLLEWRSDVEELAAVEEGEVEPLDVADPKAVAAWLDSVAVTIEDAISAGEDATRPLRRRMLGPVIARSHIGEARRSLRVLIESARRGVVASPAGGG
jgi:hypothetical protein